MTEQEAERSPLDVITEQGARLQEAKAALRSRVLQRAGRHDTTREVQDMLQALDIPSLHVSDEEAGRIIVEGSRWNGDPADYTEQGLRRQVGQMQEKTMQWFTTLREQLDRLIGARLISREDADTALRDLGAPEPPAPEPVPQVTVRFSIVGSASAPLNVLPPATGTDEVVRDFAEQQLRDAIISLVRRSGFTPDGDIAIEIGVTRG